jgi:hypothetical protein
VLRHAGANSTPKLYQYCDTEETTHLKDAESWLKCQHSLGVYPVFHKDRCLTIASSDLVTLVRKRAALEPGSQASPAGSER